jgi:MYXO-CTERM domain-containing protein
MRKVVWLVCALAVTPMFVSAGVAVAAEAAKEAAKPAPPAVTGGVATWGEDQKIDKTKVRDEYGGRMCGTSGTWQGSAWMVLAMLGLLVRRRR